MYYNGCYNKFLFQDVFEDENSQAIEKSGTRTPIFEKGCFLVLYTKPGKSLMNQTISLMIWYKTYVFASDSYMNQVKKVLNWIGSVCFHHENILINPILYTKLKHSI